MNRIITPHHPLSGTARRAAIALAGAATILSASATLADDASPVPGACWTQAPGELGSVAHPTDPEAIVLRMSVGGGFVPLEVAFLESPTFTLYGNNVAVFRPSVAQDPITDPLPPYQCVELTPEQVDRLLTDALEAGGLRQASDLYPDPYIADTPNTVFTIDADGVDKTITIQALGFDPQAPDPEARARFEALADQLSRFSEVATGTTEFHVPRYRALLSDVWIDAPADAVAWPWDGVTPADFSGDGLAVTSLTPEQVAMVVPVPSGGQGYIVLELPDGTQQSLAIRPLLPDEVAAEVTS
jgi:hypothetical protein